MIVRPQPGADSTAHAAAELGLRPVVMPLFTVEPVAWQAPDPAGYDGLLLTSANAPRNAGASLERLLALPAHCVGAATAEAARETGIAVGAVGSGGVDSLLGSLPANARLLHLCGIDRRETTARSVDAIPVYRSAEAPCPPEFGGIEGAVIAVHSPRAGSAVARCADACGLNRASIAIAAISAEAAGAVGSGGESVAAAAEPSDPALLAIALRLCNNPR